MNNYLDIILNSDELTIKEKQVSLEGIGIRSMASMLNVIIEHSVKTGEFVPYTGHNSSYLTSNVSIYHETLYVINCNLNNIDNIERTLNYKYDIYGGTHSTKIVLPQIIAMMTIYNYSEELYESVSNSVIKHCKSYHCYSNVTDFYTLLCDKIRYRLKFTKNIEFLIECIKCMHPEDQVLLKEFIKSIDILENDTDNFKKFIEYIL